MKNHTKDINVKQKLRLLLVLFIALPMGQNAIAQTLSLQAERIEIEAELNDFECEKTSPWGFSWGAVTTFESVAMVDSVNNVAQMIAIQEVNNSPLLLNFKFLLDAALIQANEPFGAAESSIYDSVSEEYQQAIDQWRDDYDTCKDIVEKIEAGAHIGIGRAEIEANEHYLYTLIIFIDYPLTETIPASANTLGTRSSASNRSSAQVVKRSNFKFRKPYSYVIKKAE